MNRPAHKSFDWMRSLGPALWRVARPSPIEKVEPTWSGLYKEGARTGIQPRVDVYLPQTRGPHPSVLLVHGGGFVLGSRSMAAMRYLAANLNSQGYAVASIDYRLIFRGGRLDEGLEDVSDAWEWWQKNKATFSLDASRMAILGCSAGAALTTLTSVWCDGIWKMVGIYGVYDFCDLPGSPSRLPARLLLGTPDEKAWAARSPIRQLGAKLPTLLMHGTADTLVKKRHTDEMAQARRAARYPVTTRYYVGEPHGFLQDGPSRSVVPVALRDILDFLEE